MRLIRLWFTDVLGQLEELRHQPGRVGERPRGGHDVRRFVDRRLLPGPGERRARHARPEHLRAAAVGRPARARGPHVLRHRQPRRHAVRGRPPPGAAPQPRQGPRAGLHVLRRARAWSSSTSPRNGNGRARSRSTRARYFDLTTTDVAGTLRKRTIQTLETMGIPVEYSFHEDSPSQHEIDLRHTDALTMADSVMTFRLVVKEAAAPGGPVRHVHAQAAGGRAGLGHAHPHEPVRGRRERVLRRRRPVQALARSARASSPGCCTTPRRSPPSPTRR